MGGGVRARAGVLEQRGDKGRCGWGVGEFWSKGVARAGVGAWSFGPFGRARFLGGALEQLEHFHLKL